MDSVFTKIINGEIPGNFVWNDEHCVVITTIQPLRKGHLLVIPKVQIDHWDDLTDDIAAHLMLVAKKITKAIKKVYPCTRVGLIIAGLEVPHTHLHLIPVDSMSDFDFSQAAFAPAEELQQVAKAIKAALI